MHSVSYERWLRLGAGRSSCQTKRPAGCTAGLIGEFIACVYSQLVLVLIVVPTVPSMFEPFMALPLAFPPLTFPPFMVAPSVIVAVSVGDVSLRAVIDNISFGRTRRECHQAQCCEY